MVEGTPQLAAGSSQQAVPIQQLAGHAELTGLSQPAEHTVPSLEEEVPVPKGVGPEPNEPGDIRHKRTVVMADIHEGGGAKSQQAVPVPAVKKNRPLPQYSNATEWKADEEIQAFSDSDNSNVENQKDADTL